MDKLRLYIERPTDRDEIAAILFRNGYTVRQGKERKGNRTKTCVECWQPDKLVSATEGGQDNADRA